MNIAKDELVKTEIVFQAQALFKQFGLKKTTMDEIALACGKAKSTLYHYYKSKEEVFDAVIRKEMTSLRQVVKNSVDKETILDQKILTYFITFHEEVLNRMNLYRVVKQELKIASIGQVHFSMVMNFEESYISGILLEHYTSEKYKHFSKEDIPWLSKTLIAAFLGIVKYTVESDDGIDKEKLKLAATMIIPKIFS